MNILERDIELCRNNKPNVIKYVKEKGLSSLSFFCATTGFSVIIAHVYVSEEFPEYREECERKIKVLKDFYGY